MADKGENDSCDWSLVVFVICFQKCFACNSSVLLDLVGDPVRGGHLMDPSSGLVSL